MVSNFLRPSVKGPFSWPIVASWGLHGEAGNDPPVHRSSSTRSLIIHSDWLAVWDYQTVLSSFTFPNFDTV